MLGERALSPHSLLLPIIVDGRPRGIVPMYRSHTKTWRVLQATYPLKKENYKCGVEPGVLPSFDVDGTYTPPSKKREMPSMSSYTLPSKKREMP